MSGKRIARFFAGSVMLVAGINHFVMPDPYESIVPDALPYQRELVYVSGVAEIAGALGSMHPRTRRPAGVLLMATLIAVFPANVIERLRSENSSCRSEPPFNEERTMSSISSRDLTIESSSLGSTPSSRTVQLAVPLNTTINGLRKRFTA